MQRRQFIKFTTLSAIFSGAAVKAMAKAKAQLVDMMNPIVMAVQYIADGTKNKDKSKVKQKCETCALYTGKKGAKQGPCSLFAGNAPKNLVSAKGWCASYAKKA